MNIRWTLGPQFGAVTAPDPNAPAPAPEPPAAAPVAPPKVDVEVTVGPVEGWDLPVTVQAYTLETHNHLVLVRAYLVPDGVAPPADGPAFIDSTHPVAEADVSARLDGHAFALTLPHVAVGSKHVGFVVLGHEVP